MLPGLLWSSWPEGGLLRDWREAGRKSIRLLWIQGKILARLFVVCMSPYEFESQQYVSVGTSQRQKRCSYNSGHRYDAQNWLEMSTH